MEIYTTIRDFQRYLEEERKKGLTTGFVPTMGALHEGHLSLIRRSVAENGITVCSIFVNPIQFNNRSDLDNYPRMPEKDTALLQEAGCNAVLIPSEKEMYPGDEPRLPEIDFGTLDKVMEGACRPGHFRGVAIVVKRLFDIVDPDKAYFGKKDYQQLAIIRHLVGALGLRVQVVPGDTVREADGLAMSSRNLRLTPSERKAAPEIYRTLVWVRDHMGSFSPAELKQKAIDRLAAVPGFSPDYFEIVDSVTLQPVETKGSTAKPVALTAVFVGQVRLIDNLELF